MIRRLQSSGLRHYPGFVHVLRHARPSNLGRARRQVCAMPRITQLRIDFCNRQDPRRQTVVLHRDHGSAKQKAHNVINSLPRTRIISDKATISMLNSLRTCGGLSTMWNSRSTTAQSDPNSDLPRGSARVTWGSTAREWRRFGKNSIRGNECCMNRIRNWAFPGLNEVRNMAPRRFAAAVLLWARPRPRAACRYAYRRGQAALRSSAPRRSNLARRRRIFAGRQYGLCRFDLDLSSPSVAQPRPEDQRRGRVPPFSEGKALQYHFHCSAAARRPRR